MDTFWLKIKQFWPFEEISICSNGGHLGRRAWLSDIILKGTDPGTIPARFGLIWFREISSNGQNCFILSQNVSILPNLTDYAN
jgi:hypothetical protein